MSGLIYFLLGVLSMWIINAIYVTLLEIFTNGVLWPEWAKALALFPIIPFLFVMYFARRWIDKWKKK